ncbi:MAG: CYTH domain-containing protein [Patescibacteria group bacterium]
MPSKQRHEYELKFKVGSDRTSIPAARKRLQEAGFVPGARAIETDYLPDTPDDVCKKAKMLLRFRQVEGTNARELLLTLKIRQADNGILHFHEYETDLYSPDPTIIATINNLLQSQVGLRLNESVVQAKTLDEVREAVKSLGLTKHRILLSKYRENFSLGDDNATIDYFPDGMGLYVEFESHSAVALHQSIKSAEFDASTSINTDYGDLLKLHKADLQGQEQRTALFSESDLTFLDDMIKGDK